MKLMKRCPVCRNPSFDDEARGGLCEFCARIIDSHSLSEGEKFATRALREFVSRMEACGYPQMARVVNELDGFTGEQIEAATAEEILGYLGMTERECAFAFSTLIGILQGVSA